MRRRRYRKSLNLYEAARQDFVSARLPLQLKHYDMLMAVMVPREKWTDERLDDLNKKVDDGFADTKAEMREGFADTKAEMRAGFARLDADIRQLNARFDSLNRNLLAGMVVIVAALIGTNAF
ncbi:MAG TPA: hypothetical protein VFK14_11920 [Solirubrobacterales bacterium]|nr:hypothetical protein [Solirubrobacterales bacterium]